MLGAIQKKIYGVEDRVLGKVGLGWNYELIFVSMLLVILSTDGGKYVLFH